MRIPCSGSIEQTFVWATTTPESWTDFFAAMSGANCSAGPVPEMRRCRDDVRPRSRPVRPDLVPAQRAERAAAAGRLARPLAELRPRAARGDEPRDHPARIR